MNVMICYGQNYERLSQEQEDDNALLAHVPQEEKPLPRAAANLDYLYLWLRNQLLKPENGCLMFLDLDRNNNNNNNVHVMIVS